MTSTNTRVIISGGGTGGHLFPALAIADAIRKKEPSAAILFVGARGKIEMERVPRAGYEIEGLDIRGLQRSLSAENLKFPIRLLKSIKRSFEILENFRPHIAVGVGGYASGPLLWAAGRKRIPAVIQEQNSYPGITNRILGKKARKIFVAYRELESFFDPRKVMLTGNPVRQDLLNVASKRDEALEFFGLQSRLKTILLTGGSLGARTLNQSAEAHLNELKNRDIQLIWQTGKFYYPGIKERIAANAGQHVKLKEFIGRVDLAYAAADLIIARAGAGTISELCVVGKPVILVPSPNVAEDHQTKNAMALVKEHAADLIPDREAVSKLIPHAVELLQDTQKQQQLSRNIRRLARTDAAEIIADEILKISREEQHL